MELTEGKILLHYKSAILFLIAFFPSLLLSQKSESAAEDYIRFYQKHISGIRGFECPMYPSCSNFGLKVFREKNMASAFVMTSDRLMRCGHDHLKYHRTFMNGGFKTLDLPANEKVPQELIYQGNRYYYGFSDTITRDSSMLFITNLINTHYYEEALLEILRVEFNTQTFQLPLFINKLICLKATNEYEKALFEYQTKCPQEFRSDPDVLFQIVSIHYLLKNFEQAENTCQKLMESCRDSLCNKRVMFFAGLTQAQKSDWQKANNIYEQMLHQYPSDKMAHAAFSITNKALNQKKKRPTLAALISVVPGLGYAYTGNKQTALSAFLLNGLLAYGTYTTIKSGNYGLAAITGIFGLSFYIGNIYGSAQSAKRWNEQQKSSAIRKLEYSLNL